MKEENENRDDKEKASDEKENARVGYQAAVDLTIKEENLFWSQFNALLVANSILITALSIILSAELDQDLLPIWAIAIAGIFLCFLWVLLTERRDSYRLYYLLCAREIEESNFGSCFEIYSRRGENFSEGSKVEFSVRDGENMKRKHQLPCLGRVKVLCWSYLLVATFAVIYLFIFLLDIGISYEISLVVSLFGFIALFFFSMIRVK